MKKLFYTIFSTLLLIVILFLIYRNIPFKFTRSNDIRLGNKLIENINSYQSKFKKIPKNDDWKTLQDLGFKIEMMGTTPSYESNQNDEYELIFFEGFDGPYLIWNSKEKRWKIDFPTIFTKKNEGINKYETNKSLKKIRGKTVVFLRPNSEKFEAMKDEDGLYEVDSDFGFAVLDIINNLKTNPEFKTIESLVLTERYIKIEDCKNCPQILDRDSIYYGIILTAPNKGIKIIPNIETLHYLNDIEEYFK